MDRRRNREDKALELMSPSRTAFGAAAHRAAHQVLEEGRIFHDPLAFELPDLNRDEVVEEARANPSRTGLRHFIAARSRFSEDMMAESIAKRGVTQIVILGAGLDTLCCRWPFGAKARLFEVDHPATQAWKQQRLQTAGLQADPAIVFVPVNFEADALIPQMVESGFRLDQPTFFSWLGVTPYLKEETTFATLGQIGGLTAGAEVVFDYPEPRDAFPEAQRKLRDQLAARVAAQGEPFLSAYTPQDLKPRLESLGFRRVLDLGPRDIAAKFFPNALDHTPEHGGHILHATL